jgi:hypothetical protein
MKWTEDRALRGLTKNGKKFQLETLKTRNHTEDFGAYIRIIPRWILKKLGFQYIDWINLAHERIE